MTEWVSVKDLDEVIFHSMYFMSYEFYDYE